MPTQEDCIAKEAADGVKTQYLSKKNTDLLNRAILMDIATPKPHGRACIANRLRKKLIAKNVDIVNDDYSSVNIRVKLK